MFADILRLSRHTLIYGAGNMLSRMLAFLLIPFFTNHLTPAQYGVYSLYYLAIAIVHEVVRMGQDIALLRFYVPETDEGRRRTIFSTVFLLALMVTTVIAAAFWIFAPEWVRLVVRLPEYPPWTVQTLQLCALIVWLDNLSAFPLVAMRGEGRAGWFTFVKIAGAGSQLLLTIWFLVGLKRGVLGIFEANALSAALALALTAPMIIRRLRLAFDRAVLAECLKFGLPNVPNLLFVVVIELSDRKILELFRGVEEAGLYSAGYRLGMFLAIVATGFRFAWQPFFLQISGREDAPTVYARVLTYYMAVAVWLYLLLTAFVDPLVRWDIPQVGRLIAPEFWPGLKVFPVVLLAHLFNGAFAVFVVGIYIQKRTRVLPLITGIAALVNLGGNILLVPKFGMWAAAWLTAASYALMAVLLYLYIQPKYPVAWEWRRLVHLFAAAVGVYGVTLLTGKGGLAWIGWAAAALFPVLMSFSGFLTAGEASKLRKWRTSGGGQ